MRRYSSLSTCLPAAMLLTTLFMVLATGMAHSQPAPTITAIRVDGLESVAKEAVLDEVKNILKLQDPVDDDKLKAARVAVMKMGFFDEVTVSTETAAQGAVVVITVVEKMKIKKITFVGNTVLSDTKLEKAIFTKVGHGKDDRAIRRDVRRIEDAYSEEGYQCRVAQMGVDEFGVLTFVIEELRIESIDVSGLKRTKREVVMRELTIKPGELYQEKKLYKDIDKITAIGIFSDVRFDLLPGKNDPTKGLIVVIKVTEKRTGQASVALGYSSLDKTVLVLSLAETNLRGRAERAAVNIELFGRSSFDVSFMEPYIDKRNTSMEVSLFNEERRRRFVGGAAISTSADVFDERREGGTLKFTRPDSETGRTSLMLRSEKVSSSFFQATRPFGTSLTGGNLGNLNQHQVSPPDNPNLNPDVPGPGSYLGPIILAAPLHPEGKLSSISFGKTRDTREPIVEPRTGAYSGGTLEVAGTFLGGSVSFRKLSLEHRRFFKAGKKDTLAFRLMGGLSQGNLPLFESYSVGGAATLRGYEEDRFRGEKMLILNSEYRHPINKSLTVVGFVDIGDAFGGQFVTVVPEFNIPAEDSRFKAHTGAGAGLRVQTPFGPIRLDFGWGSEGSQAHFSIGHMF